MKNKYITTTLGAIFSILAPLQASGDTGDEAGKAPDSGSNAIQGANITLTDISLMHEMRATPLPLDGAVVADRAVSFQWPLPADFKADKTPMDGQEVPVNLAKNKLSYTLRYARDEQFTLDTVEVTTRWPFYNPEKDLEAGLWYWQYGYNVDDKVVWGTKQSFTVVDNPDKFCPPSLGVLLNKLPDYHPRVYLDKKDWDSFRIRTENSADRKAYIEAADKVLETPMKSVDDINTSLLKGLKNDAQRKSMLTRESRRIVDTEESNISSLVHAYLLTKDSRYSDEAIARTCEIASWGGHENITGDFNDATFVSLCSMVYDACYDILDKEAKEKILGCIKTFGAKMYNRFNNNLENHIADNHVWQMTLRIFTFAAFSVYGDIPEAETWVNYCYNVWLARFPGLNKDGGWHNGDSYFTVNVCTLVEVPYFYSRITGFDFFSDPWYKGNAMYIMFQQPPFSKSAGNGSSHQKVMRPNTGRINLADALAKLTNNTFLADYVRRTLKQQPEYLQRAIGAKAADLGWFRLQCTKLLPDGDGLTALPMGYVFPETGLASFQTNWDRVGGNAMLSFRSSPYGSTSHALANQNAFNTFFGGQALFYSSGHHTAFIDKHSIYCHRGTRAHNTILVNGMGQRIGVEGYGWIPRYYVGQKIGYVLGDASNAYGKVVSDLWLGRAKDAEVEFTPENGWDDVPLMKYRRHIVQLGTTGYTFIYDELESSEPATYTYMLHTVTNPMEVDARAKNKYVYVKATSKNGVSDAYIFSTDKVQTDTTSQFFSPAVNWLKADSNGNFEQYKNHWHFNATSGKHKVYRFATVIYTHSKPKEGANPPAALTVRSDGSVSIKGWLIRFNVSETGLPWFSVTNTKEGEDVSVEYSGEATTVREDGYETTLVDKLPELEI